MVKNVLISACFWASVCCSFVKNSFEELKISKVLVNESVNISRLDLRKSLCFLIQSLTGLSYSFRRTQLCGKYMCMLLMLEWIFFMGLMSVSVGSLYLSWKLISLFALSSVISCSLESKLHIWEHKRELLSNWILFFTGKYIGGGSKEGNARDDINIRTQG